jgi:hypothetical protein
MALSFRKRLQFFHPLQFVMMGLTAENLNHDFISLDEISLLSEASADAPTNQPRLKSDVCSFAC